MSESGSRTFGPYVLLERLGSGGAGAAYLAVEGGRPLVIKRLHERWANDDVVAARLRHEAVIAVSVDSPHVVRVLDVGAVAGEPFVAMERVPGCTIARLLATSIERREWIEVRAAASLIHDALAGLEAIHDAVHPETREPLDAVHRDVSPRNLIVTPEARAVVIDLGLGRSNLRDWATKTGTLLGTPGYVSPEQIRGGRADHRSDLYALAVILFELLARETYLVRGEPLVMFEQCLQGPFRALASLRADVPPALDRLLERALALDPAERFASAREMRDALAAAAGLEGPIAPPELPAGFRALIAESEARVSALLASPAEVPVADEPTELWVRRSITTPMRPPEPSTTRSTMARTRTSPIEMAGARPALIVSSPVPIAPRRGGTWLLAAGALAVSIVAGFAAYRASVREPVVVVVPPASQAVAPRAAQRAAAVAPPSDDPPAADEPARAPAEPPRPTRRAPAAPEPQPPAETPPVDFEALALAAAELKARRPELAADLDALIVDATMWRRSEASPRRVEAHARLTRTLRELEAR